MPAKVLQNLNSVSAYPRADDSLVEGSRGVLFIGIVAQADLRALYEDAAAERRKAPGRGLGYSIVPAGNCSPKKSLGAF